MAFRYRLAASVVVCLVSLGCGRAGALFSGQTQDPRVAPAQVLEQESMPADHRLLGVVETSCEREEPAFGELEEQESGCRSLAELMCSQESLSRALRERAAEVGGTLLVGRRCSSEASEDGLSVRCIAEVATARDERAAHLAKAPAPVTDQVVPLRDEREADAIQVMYTALTAKPRAPRAPHRVAEQVTMPVQNVAIGDLLARCGDECSAAALRESLRVAAGRVGASDLVGVRCLHKGEDLVCSARATGPSADPRQVAAAR
ncbi:MAG TPA: hypothetical protein VHO25_02290, partial [Polyangiaceae bacterium]|nr:hypothetical protein [Polyangiaceae bacterium]